MEGLCLDGFFAPRRSFMHEIGPTRGVSRRFRWEGIILKQRRQVRLSSEEAEAVQELSKQIYGPEGR